MINKILTSLMVIMAVSFIGLMGSVIFSTNVNLPTDPKPPKKVEKLANPIDTSKFVNKSVENNFSINFEKSVDKIINL